MRYRSLIKPDLPKFDQMLNGTAIYQEKSVKRRKITLMNKNVKELYQFGHQPLSIFQKYLIFYALVDRLTRSLNSLP